MTDDHLNLMPVMHNIFTILRFVSAGIIFFYLKLVKGNFHTSYFTQKKYVPVKPPLNLIIFVSTPQRLKNKRD